LIFHDEEEGNLVERFFSKLKHFPAVATRYDNLPTLPSLRQTRRSPNLDAVYEWVTWSFASSHFSAQSGIRFAGNAPASEDCPGGALQKRRNGASWA
jgi:hypothetical protein